MSIDRFLTPIQHDFTAAESAVARVGQSAYWDSQRVEGKAWEDLSAAERFRWQLAAHLVVTERVTDPELVRAIYLVGYGPEQSEPWEDLKPRFRARWERITAAMVVAIPAPASAPLQPDPGIKLAKTPKPKRPRKPRMPKTTKATPAPEPVDQPSTLTAVATLRERLAARRAEERKAGLAG